MAQQNLIRSAAGDAAKKTNWGWVIFGVAAVATIGGTIFLVTVVSKAKPFGIL